MKIIGKTQLHHELEEKPLSLNEDITMRHIALYSSFLCIATVSSFNATASENSGFCSTQKSHLHINIIPRAGNNGHANASVVDDYWQRLRRLDEALKAGGSINSVTIEGVGVPLRDLTLDDEMNYRLFLSYCFSLLSSNQHEIETLFVQNDVFVDDSHLSMLAGVKTIKFVNLSQLPAITGNSINTLIRELKIGRFVVSGCSGVEDESRFEYVDRGTNLTIFGGREAKDKTEVHRIGESQDPTAEDGP